MGDIGFLLKGVRGVCIGLGVGTAHGFIDGYGSLTNQVPEFAQQAMIYGPSLFSGVYVGTERNGLWTAENMIKGGLVAAGFTAVSTGVGYGFGVIVGGGIEKLIS